MRQIDGRGPSHVRWGLLLVALAASGFLVGSSWVNRNNVRNLAESAARGQGVLFFLAARRHMRQKGPPQPRLDAFVDENRDLGLRYAAVILPRGRRLESGQPHRGKVRFRSPDGLQFVGDRVRWISPTWPGPHRVRGGKHRRRARFARRFARGPRVLLEFEPLEWRELKASADAQLLFSLLASGLLLAAAIVFWAMSRRAQATRNAMARQKHLAALGEMSAVMAHEIRNPLTSLKGHAQLLAEDLADEDFRNRIERVVRDAQRLEELTDHLLNFVGTDKLARTEEDPVGMVHSVVESLEPARIEVDDSGAPPRWSFDAPRMRQVLSNLLINAVQAQDTGELADQTPVTLTVREENQRLVFLVRDHGPGLPDEDPERLFEPFVTTKTRGTGLGLAVAKRITELHGGTIRASNHPAGGGLLRVEIPDGQG